MSEQVAGVYDIMGQIESWEEVDETQMSDFIDGPYCPPSRIEEEDGTFDLEYDRAKDEVCAALRDAGISLDVSEFIPWCEGSRCFAFYLGDKFVLAKSVLIPVRIALKKLDSDGLDYCASIALDWRDDLRGSRGCAYIGMTSRSAYLWIS